MRLVDKKGSIIYRYSRKLFVSLIDPYPSLSDQRSPTRAKRPSARSGEPFLQTNIQSREVRVSGEILNCRESRSLGLNLRK